MASASNVDSVQQGRATLYHHCYGPNCALPTLSFYIWTSSSVAPQNKIHPVTTQSPTSSFRTVRIDAWWLSQPCFHFTVFLFVCYIALVNSQPILWPKTTVTLTFMIQCEKGRSVPFASRRWGDQVPRGERRKVGAGSGLKRSRKFT